MGLKPSKTPLYSNCVARDPRGNAIFRCDLKKMQWYLDKGLAKRIQDDPPRIQLLFEPGGPGHRGDPFFMQPRKNRCVVCGATKRLSRHHILPHCYRRWFPRDLDRYGTYDVMALCIKHHTAYERSSQKLKEKLAEEYEAPVKGIGGRADPEIGRGVQAARAIQRYGDQIPAWRMRELKAIVVEVFGKEELTDEFVTKTIKENRRVEWPHGRLVAKKLTDYDSINAFTVRWRKHFLATMKPRFMPEHWEADRTFQPEDI